ncbi:ABC transporter ATP-binding protein [Curtobacterium sp. ISL-83]|uniref:ABC transporter ATP-binding protein n=1 Tax=Curtobacterium sp. ISL-83 TaxID=2819145 RepID=UPI001BE577CE|nr:ABC transporter ATP-binding protein [Curtobacterium sp. ISL-83]MBT2501212.1 ABC transporter ATP-binding protein [Curtobacterium sp. ISL-83]
MPSILAPVRTGTAVLLDRVSKTYPNGPETTTALDEVTLQVDTGSFTAVMGPSGSGKSTLLNCAAGLDVVSRGRVAIGGVDIGPMSPDALTRFRREHVGFVFQGYNLVPHLTIRENVRLPLTLAGVGVEDDRLDALLASVGIGGLRDRLPGQISGGQGQRAAIARALVASPDVVFADEPTGALDTATADQVLRLLRATVDERGQTLVLVTHDPRAAALADRVVFVDGGRIRDELTAPTVESVTARVLAAGRTSTIGR